MTRLYTKHTILILWTVPTSILIRTNHIIGTLKTEMWIRLLSEPCNASLMDETRKKITQWPLWYLETQGLQQLPRIVHKIGEERKQSQVFLYNFIAKQKLQNISCFRIKFILNVFFHFLWTSQIYCKLGWLIHLIRFYWFWEYLKKYWWKIQLWI